MLLMVNIIVAIAKNNRAIGINGKLPWHISDDLKRFKSLTTGHPIIMGRKTFESFGEKVLPNRKHIVITRDMNWSFPSQEVIVSHNIQEAILKAKEFDDEIFIIGGAQIYEQSLDLADRLYLTIVDLGIENADTFFPQYENIFRRRISEDNIISSNGIKLDFLVLEK